MSSGETDVASGVRLSRLKPEHLEAMSWLDRALAPDWRRDDIVCRIEAGAGVLINDQAGNPVGIAIALLNQPLPGSACMPFIGIDPARRFRGLGGSAALVLERHLRNRFRVEKVYAPIPDGRGLAVYFWLRLGYRPLAGAESPGPLTGLIAEPRPGIWMLRDSA